MAAVYQVGTPGVLDRGRVLEKVEENWHNADEEAEIWQRQLGPLAHRTNRFVQREN
jgi:hypothetical protein